MTPLNRNPKRVLAASMLWLTAALVACGGTAPGAHPHTSPTMSSSTPANAATGVNLDSAVVASFSEAVDPATINSKTFILKQGAAAVPGTVSYAGMTATFKPTQTLASGSSFTATISGARFRDGTGLASNLVWTFVTSGPRVALAPVLLGTSANYAILAQSAITNVPPSAIIGDIAISPAAESYLTGFALTDATGYATAPQILGKVYAADQASPTPINLTTAINDMGTGYTDAAGRPTPDFLELATGAIGGMTLTPGLYKWTTGVSISSNVTLTGSSSDVWIFQIAGTLLQSSGAKVLLAGGAQARNIFWQVAGGATLGTTSHFEGILLSQTAITLQTGASMNGRALAQTAVALDTNAVTQPGPAPDLTPPALASTNPASGATGVARTASISATFSKAMTSASFTSATFTLAAGGQPIAGSVTCAGSTATFLAYGPFASSTVITATVAGSVQDLAGNALGAGHSWSFTTAAAPDITPPVVTSTNPAAGAMGVAPGAAISATFGEAMAPLTINQTSFTVSGPAGAAVSGAVAYHALTRVATFQPGSPLAAGTVFQAKISSGLSGVTDLDGNRLASDVTWSFITRAHVVLAPVLLGTSGNYVILAETKISNVPTSAITGNVAISPAAESYITGFVLTDATGYATAPEVVGKIYAADQAGTTPTDLTSAIGDMGLAYTDAAGRPAPDFLELATGAIGGLTLQAGLYKWTGDVGLSSDITLTGTANDVWIFQIAGNLSESTGTKVFLTGGAQAKNVFWQVAGAVTLAKTSHFEGIILSQTAIILQTGASVNGRLLAQSAVVLDSNAVTQK